MNEEKIIEKLIEHDGKFDKINERFDNVERKIIDSHEEIMTVLKRLDEERIFTS